MITCDICGRKIKDVEAAIDAGWMPSYWIDDVEFSRVVCDECIGHHIEFVEDVPVMKLTGVMLVNMA